MALFLAGTAAGSLLGGFLGDAAAARYRHHGRIFVVQSSCHSILNLTWGRMPLGFCVLEQTAAVLL